MANLDLTACWSRLTVRMDVDERDTGRVAVGAPLIVRASAFPGREPVDCMGGVLRGTAPAGPFSIRGSPD